MQPPRVTLKAGREKSLRQRHPWIFSGAIERVEGNPATGTVVVVHSADGAFLASAAWSPQSQIRGRVWSFDARDTIDAEFLRRRVHRAVHARGPLLDGRHSGCRLVHGESDGLPGLIADRYGSVLVVQFLAAGTDFWRDALVSALQDASGCSTVFERSDAEVRTLEGLAPRTGLVAGVLPNPVALVEDALTYRVDVEHGQKTGFYLDQRDNRHRIRELADGRDVLNCFCYTGGFSIAALAGGARSVVSIDSSAEALAFASQHVRDNGLDAARAEWRDADVFTELRKLRDGARNFDLIVLDPPKFAPTAQHAERATRAYKDINLLALKLLRPGGLLATFSCSGGVSAELFQKVVAGAALDARADAAIVGRFGPSADHPVALDFPEGDYLKGLLVLKRA